MASPTKLMIHLRHPTHLKPNLKISMQYVRMAVDIVRDMELDQEPDSDSSDVAEPVSEETLQRTRAYLATYYLASSRASSFRLACSLTYTAATARACGILVANARDLGDRLLPWLVRYEHLNMELSGLRRAQRRQPPSQHQSELMLRGIASQLDEYDRSLPADLANLSQSHSFSSHLTFDSKKKKKKKK
jgi:hypothetical protein